MPEQGTKVSDLPQEGLRERLEEETDGKVGKRLVAGREYLDGESQVEIEEKYGWPEQTGFAWVNQLEEAGRDEDFIDEPPPGRPASLTDEQFERLRSAV